MITSIKNNNNILLIFLMLMMVTGFIIYFMYMRVEHFTIDSNLVKNKNFINEINV